MCQPRSAPIGADQDKASSRSEKRRRNEATILEKLPCPAATRSVALPVELGPEVSMRADGDQPTTADWCWKKLAIPAHFARRAENDGNSSKDGFAIGSTQPKRPHEDWVSTLPSQCETMP